MSDQPKAPSGLERVKRWLYAKGGEERSSGCVLCGSGHGHGPVNPMEDEPGFQTKCPPDEYYRCQRLPPKARWLLSQRVFHGPDPVTPGLKEGVYPRTPCLLAPQNSRPRADP